MCAFYIIHQYQFQSILNSTRPNHTIFKAGSDLIYLHMIVVIIILIMLPILPRVELLIKSLLEHHNYLIKREVAHAIDAAPFRV